MFKRLDYYGFRDQPHLLALAEGATPLLADEIRTWREEVEVGWEAVPESPAGPAVYLELSLRLDNWTGIARRLFSAPDFADERRVRSACRDAWGRLLDKFLERSKERLDQIILETAEA